MSDEARWSAALAAAARFGITPEAFWRLSLAEWRALAQPAAAPFTRADLEALMHDHPDR